MCGSRGKGRGREAAVVGRVVVVVCPAVVVLRQVLLSVPHSRHACFKTCCLPCLSHSSPFFHAMEIQQREREGEHRLQLKTATSHTCLTLPGTRGRRAG